MHDDSALRSLRHRIVNDLNLVHGLLALAERRLEDPVAVHIFDATRSRVRTIALVHRLVWRAASSDPAARVNARSFLPEISEEAVHAARRTPTPELVLDIADHELSFESAVALGLLTRELVANAAEHAFPAHASGRICVRLTSSERGEARLAVLDDGVGLPTGMDANRADTLGLMLAQLLAEQLRGRLDVCPRAEGGTVAELHFEG